MFLDHKRRADEEGGMFCCVVGVTLGSVLKTCLLEIELLPMNLILHNSATEFSFSKR